MHDRCDAIPPNPRAVAAARFAGEERCELRGDVDLRQVGRCDAAAAPRLLGPVRLRPGGAGGDGDWQVGGGGHGGRICGPWHHETGRRDDDKIKRRRCSFFLLAAAVGVGPVRDLCTPMGDARLVASPSVGAQDSDLAKATGWIGRLDLLEFFKI